LGDQLDDAVEDLLLARDVVVQRHRACPERCSEVAHRERLESSLVEELAEGDRPIRSSS